MIIRYCTLIFAFFLMASCANKPSVPNVSNIVVNPTVERFEQDFFKIDTNRVEASLDELQKKYGSFTTDYLYNILGIIPNKDSAIKYAALFANDSMYKKIYTTVQAQYNNINEPLADIVLGLKLVKHYFPNYKVPHKIITFVGPIEGVGTALTSDGSIAIGLQGFLGSNFYAYHTEYISQVYPTYQSKRFEKAYIAINVLKNIFAEIYPQRTAGKPLNEQMIELGKRAYVLQALLPNVADTVITGYTANKLSECYKNEAFIFSFFVQNNLLFEREPSLLMPYVNDGPKTPELSETAPGNIAMFVGWQMIKQYMKQQKYPSLQKLLQTDATTIFNEVKYKP